MRVPRIPIIRGRASGPKVVLGYPVGNSNVHAFTASLLKLLAYELAKPDDERLLSKITHSQGLYVGDNRQVLAERFFESNGDWLLQIDTDIEFPHTILETLIGIVSRGGAVDERPIRILAANVPLGTYSTVAFQQTDKLGVWACYDSLPADLFPCDAAATAIMMIHRDVFEVIAGRHGQCWFNPITLPKSEPGTPVREFKYNVVQEDLAFCVRAKESGYRVWVARVPGLRHHKVRALSDDFDRAKAMAGEDSAVGELVREG